jgi:hypothetical protein
VQEIDTPAMIKFKLARVKVGVRDPSLIPPSTEITTDPYIYDAFYEVEEVVEQGGLLDEDGVIIPRISDSHVMNNAEDSPSKRARVVDHEKSGATKEGIFFTKEELNSYIMEETEKRMEQHLLKMEERILASQLQFNMQTRQELKSEIDRAVKENLNWSEDYGQGCTGDEKFNEENEMCEESSPSTSQKATDIYKECEAEAQKQMMKEKAAKAMEEDNIRQRLRPQNDANMMDKAKDLASKKNLETKGNSIPSVVNSDPVLLVDLASKMKINIGNSIEQRMHTIDIIQQLENARYSIYAESVKNARDTNRMEEELNQAQLDFDTLKPLLSDDDMGIGELDDNLEIPLQMISPPRSNFISKLTEPISVKSKVKLHRKGKKKC